MSDSASGLLGEFELNRSARLRLDYRRSIASPPAGAHVVDFEPRPFIQKALEGGINFFDMADRYSLGNLISHSGASPRDRHREVTRAAIWTCGETKMT